eukprot:s136_g18.t1
MMLLAVVTMAVARLPPRSSMPDAAEPDFASQVMRQRAHTASTLATATQLGAAHGGRRPDALRHSVGKTPLKTLTESWLRDDCDEGDDGFETLCKLRRRLHHRNSVTGQLLL